MQKQLTEGALKLNRYAWDHSSSTTIVWFVIVFLVISNLWTLFLMGREKEMREIEKREKWVQGIVTALWEEDERGDGRGRALAPPALDEWRREGMITTQLYIIEHASLTCHGASGSSSASSKDPYTFLEVLHCLEPELLLSQRLELGPP